MPDTTHLKRAHGYLVGGSFDPLTAVLLYAVQQGVRELLPPRPVPCGYGWLATDGRQHVVALTQN